MSGKEMELKSLAIDLLSIQRLLKKQSVQNNRSMKFQMESRKREIEKKISTIKNKNS